MRARRSANPPAAARSRRYSCASWPASAFLTALGDDAARVRWFSTCASATGSTICTWRSARGPQRRTFTFLDNAGERTITVLGERIVPHVSDPLPWDALGALDGVYLTGGDAGAVRAARAASVLVATPRAMAALIESRVQLDVLVRSSSDPGEAYEPGMLDPAPRLVVSTRGAMGGVWEAADGRSGAWDATALPGPAVDAYGCGDSFAAGLTYGLGSGMALADAVELAARCGAACLSGRGPFAGQLELA